MAYSYKTVLEDLETKITANKKLYQEFVEYPGYKRTALMWHIYTDPEYYSKIKKVDSVVCIYKDEDYYTLVFPEKLMCNFYFNLTFPRFFCQYHKVVIYDLYGS